MLYISTKLNKKTPQKTIKEKLPQNSVDIKDMSLPSSWRSAPALHPRQNHNKNRHLYLTVCITETLQTPRVKEQDLKTSRAVRGTSRTSLAL